ncbi:putative NPH3 domain-containing protein [Helianthus anomalus]
MLLDINYMFNMIGGLILVSHAPKRWYSAGGFWGYAKVSVAKTVDGYLAEIAKERNTSFADLGDMVSGLPR